MVQVNPDGRSAAFVPNAPLPAGHRINVFLSTRITDSVGNALTNFQYSFTASFVNDVAPPSLVSVNPPDQLTGVPTNTPITVQFSELVSSVSVQNGFQVRAAGQPITGSVALSNGNTTAVFTPNPALTANTTYTVSLDSSIVDSAGNHLSNT